MKQARLDQLADGIFAIVMTLLVLEIKVPAVIVVTNGNVLAALADAAPLFLSYLLSFMLLFTYWRGHHFIASVLAQNIDNTFTTINAFFFLFVGLVPFSTLLLGKYAATQAAIAIYGVHVIILGLLLYWMRDYVLSSPSIANSEASVTQLHHSALRILFPVWTALAAIALSFINTELSLFLFTLAIIFNLSGRSTTLMEKIFSRGKAA